MPKTDAASAKESSEIDVSSNVIADGDSNVDRLAADGSKRRNLRDIVTPLAHMAYVDQLEHKKSALMQLLKKLVSCDCL